MANSDPLAYDLDIQNPAETNGDLDYRGMRFIRNSNPNGVRPQFVVDKTQPYLCLAVQKDSYTGATDGEPNMRDRCELRDGKIPLGTPVIYAFEMRIERGIPEVNARFVCAQIKAPYYDANGGSPLVALRFERGKYFATVEHLYEEKDANFVDGVEVSKYLTGAAGN
jgi:hypothetical protein